MLRGTSAILLVLLLGKSGLALGGEIFDKVSKVPSNLLTPLGPQSRNIEKRTTIACYDVRSGTAQDCGYDFRVRGLVKPDTDVANNGGHNHDFAAHPVGTLRVIAPTPAGPSPFLAGQTSFDIVVISHAIPEVSGKIETLLNLRVPTVPPGWRTVSPESCDATQTSWCFNTTVDVGVPGLSSLPNSPLYQKIRMPDEAHKDAVACFGTPDAHFYLSAIAESYNQLSLNLLSVNDMSLLRGGLFDIRSTYASPHGWHRTGQSADINTTQGDCFSNYELNLAVNLVMPTASGSFFEPTGFSRSGRFLCEPNGNIHIDLDVVPPPSPSPFQ